MRLEIQESGFCVSTNKCKLPTRIGRILKSVFQSEWKTAWVENMVFNWALTVKLACLKQESRIRTTTIEGVSGMLAAKVLGGAQ
jgi:hypothetical protein